MQSFTTQAHQRNYRGEVVVDSPNPPRTRQKRHKIITGIVTSVMALAVIITSGLLGATTVHNHELQQQVETMHTPTTQASAEIDNQPMTLEIRPEDEKGTSQEAPISDQEHETQPMPTVKHRARASRRA